VVISKQCHCVPVSLCRVEYHCAEVQKTGPGVRCALARRRSMQWRCSEVRPRWGMLLPLPARVQPLATCISSRRSFFSSARLSNSLACAPLPPPPTARCSHWPLSHPHLAPPFPPPVAPALTHLFSPRLQPPQAASQSVPSLPAPPAGSAPAVVCPAGPGLPCSCPCCSSLLLLLLLLLLEAAEGPLAEVPADW